MPCHRQRLARARIRRARLRRPIRPVQQPDPLDTGRKRKFARTHRRSVGGGHCRWRDARSPDCPDRAQNIGDHRREKAVRGDRVGGAWRKTWRPCARLPPKGFSRDTWDCTRVNWQQRRALPAKWWIASWKSWLLRAIFAWNGQKNWLRSYAISRAIRRRRKLST